MPNKRNNPSEMSEELEILNLIRNEKRKDKEPGRWKYATSVLKERGYNPIPDENNKCIRFSFKGNTITVWPYTGWFSGKGVKDGRGINKLLKQI